MSASPVRRAIRGGLKRRRVQTLVIGLVLLVTTSAALLALGLIVASSAPFDHAFAVQRGAHAEVIVNPAVVTGKELAATTRLAEVTAAAGPFPVVTVSPEQGGYPLGPMTVAARGNPGGPVDDITLQAGHWADAPGQIVLASDPAPGETLSIPLGTKISLTGNRGSPQLTVVGMANSVTSTAAAWVAPGELAQLRRAGPVGEEMLYRFRSAGTAAQIRSDIATVAAALPRAAIAGHQSYLTIKTQQTQSVAPFVPFLVAFGIIGLVMSVLIVTNVVSGAVVAGYRRIGILKSIGFTPGQVVAAYAGQVSVPSVIGCLGGVALGNVLAIPLLQKTAEVYGAGRLRVPASVDVTVAVGMLVLVALAALLPAARAGRMGAVQAIAAGRAPRQGRGYAAHRLLARLRLPRPATIGLAAPFARPARAAATLAAILLGAAALTFAIGLSSSLSRVVTGLSHDQAEPVEVSLSNGNNIGPAGQRSILAVLRAQPGTLHYVGEADDAATLTGLSRQVNVTAFAGNATWTGYDVISGRWYDGPGQADVATGVLTATGKSVGDTVTVDFGGTRVALRIVGEVFDSDDRGMDVITTTQTLAAGGPSLTDPLQYDVGLRPGTSPAAYAQAVGNELGSNYSAQLNNSSSTVINLMKVIIGMLTLMLAIVAGLGVLNIVVMLTRERVHDLGVFKAIGMTPWQTIGMVVCWVAGTGLVAGLLAVPLGIEVHRAVLPAMASAADLGLPASMLNVYGGPEMVGLALAGVVIAMLGALLPAGWAARTRTASALHAE